jgi:hypothetical protein
MWRFGTTFTVYEIIYLQFCYEIFLVVHYLNVSFSKKIAWEKVH